MSDRPSDGMELDELRDEFDWMFEFQSRMAERIRGDADVHSLADYVGKLEAESIKLRELVRSLHMAYVGALNKCEGMDEGLIWEHCEMVDAELAKSHARFEADRHRFDVAMSELGIEVWGE